RKGLLTGRLGAAQKTLRAARPGMRAASLTGGPCMLAFWRSSASTSVSVTVPSQSNTKLVSHIDCPGGGQVWVEGATLYVGHIRPPWGPTTVDVADPREPKIIATVGVRDGWHSHKVRVAGGIMIVNQEKFGKASRTEIGGGIDIYDVSTPSAPKLITEWRTV